MSVPCIQQPENLKSDSKLKKLVRSSQMLGGNRKMIPSDYVCNQSVALREAFDPAKPQFIRPNLGKITSQQVKFECEKVTTHLLLKSTTKPCAMEPCQRPCPLMENSRQSSELSSASLPSYKTLHKDRPTLSTDDCIMVAGQRGEERLGGENWNPFLL